MDVINSLEFILPAAVPTPTNLRLRRAVRRLDDIVYRIIRERRASGRLASDLLATLLAARAEDGRAMSDEQLRDEVMTLFLAGHETTAVTLMWTWYLLSASPAAEGRLHEELDAALAGRLPQVGDLARLRYAEAVVYEALRLYPPVVVLGREAIRDCEIGGHAVPRGTTVIVSPWLLHRDPRYFAEPNAFRPERWLDGLAERLPRFAYCPFGAGPRRCIGASFAAMELVLVLATIAQHFRLRLAAGHPVVPRVDLTLRPRDGMLMSVHTRRAMEEAGYSAASVTRPPASTLPARASIR
jgi:cytochrome P450